MNIKEINILLTLLENEINEYIDSGYSINDEYCVDLLTISNKLINLKFKLHNNIFENLCNRLKGGDENDKEI